MRNVGSDKIGTPKLCFRPGGLRTFAVVFSVLLGACSSGGAIDQEKANPKTSTATSTDAAPANKDAGVIILSQDAGKTDVPVCVPIECSSTAGQYCGTIGDGCGHTRECGDCPGDEVCGAGGPSICGGGANCTPKFTCNFTGG